MVFQRSRKVASMTFDVSRIRYRKWIENGSKMKILARAATGRNCENASLRPATAATTRTTASCDSARRERRESSESSERQRSAHGKIGSMRGRWRPLRDARKKTRISYLVLGCLGFCEKHERTTVRCVNTRETRPVVVRSTGPVVKTARSRQILIRIAAVLTNLFTISGNERRSCLLWFSTVVGRRSSPSPSPSRF